MTMKEQKPIEIKPQKAARSSRTRQVLLSHLRHELRTPLNAIIGYSEMLIEDARDMARKELLIDLENIHSNGNQLLGLVNDILDPMKIETIYKDLDLESFGVKLRYELHPLLNEIIDLSEKLMEDAEKKEQEDINSDLKRIHEAAEHFLSYISDIVKFLNLETGDMAMAVELGTPKASSTVRVVMETPRPPSEEAIISPKSEQGSLLVVDDSEMNRELLLRHLRRQGHTVTVAENGRQALEIIKTNTFDLVLLDIMMPEMNGFQVLQHLKSHETWRDIPVIMISALDEMDNVVRCIEMGAEDYLPKPFDPVLLRARVGACLEKKRLHDVEKLYAKSMERELEIGREIQASFFPDSLPQLRGWEITAHFQAARQVAGDFYDAFPLSDGRVVGLVIADVCDKGVGAALFMGLFRSLIRAFAVMHYSGRWVGMTDDVHQTIAEPDSFGNTKISVYNPGKALQSVIDLTNNYIAHTHSDANMFATLFFGVLEPATGILTYINGGHLAPVIVGHTGIKESLLPTGPAVGMMPDMPFKTGQTRFEPGDTLIAFTDGITEAQRSDGQFFGEERLLSLLAEPAASIDLFVNRIMKSVREYTAGSAQSDDITLLIARRVM